MPSPRVFPRPLVLGHRGAPRDAPENTLRAFSLALRHGADGVELDVQLTRDGVPVVLHDATLQRTTDGHGEVAALGWAELARLRAGGEPVPSLEQIAVWAAASRAWVDVELKNPRATEAALRVLEKAGVLTRVVLSSFHPEALAAAGRLQPQVRRFYLTERWDLAAQDALARCGAGGVCLQDAAATPAALREAAAVGLPVIVWTVDDAARVRELLRAGVAAVITNLPARAVTVRRELGLE